MGPLLMAAIIVGLVSAFAWSAQQRMKLLSTGRPEVRWDRVPERLKAVFEYVMLQRKMPKYPVAGIAHILIFVGFSVLLLRTLVLWGRGFVPSFNLFILGPEGFLGLPLGHAYELAKDVVALLVIAGALTFVWFRAVRREARMTLSGEGLLILGIIVTMMVADTIYDGAMFALAPHQPGLCVNKLDAAACASVSTVTAPLAASDLGAPVHFRWYAPVGSLFSLAFSGLGLGTGALVVLAHVGFWIHSSLVLIFLNILPYSKHFHILTVVPNVFATSLEPAGRLPKVADTTEQLMAMVEASSDPANVDAKPVGARSIEDFSWKAILDFYTCTECGRCTDNCPAHKTGKILSPKQLTLNLRDHLYANEGDLVDARAGTAFAAAKDANGHGASGDGADAHADAAKPPTDDVAPAPKRLELVPNVIHPDVLWACTTCRACEEQCPVLISYVDKIVDMRRNLVLLKGEFPAELSNPFSAMEINGNPWNIARVDRGLWTDGLDIPTMADKPDAEVLYWVGCAGSYDDRAKKVARATASLLQAAGVDFAILGSEETCTGDPARRAGNEYLFMMLAEQNAATLNGYKEKGGVRTIVTACPHCFNTLANEYPDFGAKFDVVHHTDFLLGLLAKKKLTPKHPVKGRVVFHDSCYLGRYNGVYEPPREILARIPGVELVEVEEWNRSKGLCCGAGGAQMWMEEQNKDRVNVKRTLQLLDAVSAGTPRDPGGAKTVASGCPFCMTMLTDGLKAESKEDEIRQLDVAEILATSCLGEGQGVRAGGTAPSAGASSEGKSGARVADGEGATA